MLSYIKAMGKYANFRGRSSRMEFWGFTIVNWVIWAVIIYFYKMFPTGVGSNVMVAVVVMYLALTLIPFISVMSRRWHDLGRTGKWCLLNIVPVIGYIVTLGFFLYKGDGFTNGYGVDPYSKSPKRNRKR